MLAGGYGSITGAQSCKASPAPESFCRPNDRSESSSSDLTDNWNHRLRRAHQEYSRRIRPFRNAAPGGGNGQVWVNTSSKAYHKEASQWYGKTKHGKYMSEQDAIKEGDHAAKN